MTRRVGLVLAPLEQPPGHETLEPAREQARRDPEVLLELLEARVAVEGVVKDQQGPPLADEAERRRQWAILHPLSPESLPPWPVASFRVTAIFELSNFYSSSDARPKEPSYDPVPADCPLSPTTSRRRNADTRTPAGGSCFTYEAVGARRGPAAGAVRPGSAKWREKVANAYEYTVEVRGAAKRIGWWSTNVTRCTPTLEGTFPGGTVDLTFRFGLRAHQTASPRCRSCLMESAES